MPRAGGVYSAPPGTTATPNTTVASAPYNALVADLVADANAARPVTAGGTGATSPYGANDAINNQGADIASAAATNLAAATGVYLNITGTVTITSLGTLGAGIERETTFTGILTLTHNATSLILPGAANIITAAGDVARWRSLGSGNWKCVDYLRASGSPVVNTLTQPALTLEQSATPTPTAEGRVMWDTDDDAIVVGDGAATRIFLPLPAGTVAGDLLYLSAAKVLSRLAKGTAFQAIRMNAGATAPEWATKIALAGVVSASGTSVDFTGIPADAKRVTAVLSAISTNGTSPPIFQIGPTGGVENTGYLGSVGIIGGAAASTTLSDGLRVSPIASAAADSLHGIATFILVDAATNTWAMSWVGAVSNSNAPLYAGGSKVLAGALSRLRLTTQGGANTFDAGIINVLWE